MNIQDKILDGDDNTRSVMFTAINKAYSNKCNDQEIAEFIRQELEEKDPGKWNVIVGKDFGSHVSHLSKKYGYWKLGEQSILIWKSGGAALDPTLG